MKNKVLEAFEKLNKVNSFDTPSVGDKIKISYALKEGVKSRIQTFNGVVVGTSRSNSITSKISVYRVIGKAGVLRTFFLHNPLINSLEIITKGKVRRAKLNYIVGKCGKAARIKVKK